MWKVNVSVILLLVLMSPIAAGAGPADESGIGFSRTDEPNENAFTILVPTGWNGQGMVSRFGR